MGWLEKWGLKLISTQVVVEVGVELGKIVAILVDFEPTFKKHNHIHIITFP